MRARWLFSKTGRWCSAAAVALGVGCNVSLDPPPDEARIAIAVRELVLRSFARSPLPVQGSVELANNSEFGSLEGITASIVAGNDGGWLSLTAVSTNGITVEAAAAGLGEGRYTATIEVAAPGASNSPRTLDVTFEVGEGPTLVLSADSLQFHNLPLDSGRQFVKTMAVENIGGGDILDLEVGPIAYNRDDPVQGWLAVSVDRDALVLTFTATYVNRLQCRTFVGPLARNAGHLCSANLNVISRSSSNSPVPLEVLLTFDNEPTIFLTPKGLAFTATIDGPAPANQTVGLSGTGIINDPPLTNYQVGTPFDNTGAPVPWLGASVVDSTVTVAVDQSGLPLGTFEAGIEVTHPPIASGGDPARPVQPDTILVTLLVEPPPPVPPSIELSATNVTISPTRSASVTITNGGDGALDGIRVTSGPDWALAFLSSSSAPSTLTVSAHPTIRPTAGTTGQISIAGDGVAPVTLSVTFQP